MSHALCIVISPLGSSKCTRSVTPAAVSHFFSNLQNKGPQRHIRPLFITNELKRSLTYSLTAAPHAELGRERRAATRALGLPGELERPRHDHVTMGHHAACRRT